MMKHYLDILRKHRHPIRFILARLLVITGFCRMLTIQQRGYRLRFHPANLPTNLWIEPASREEPLAFFNAYLKPGDKVVDVGANVGDTVLTAAVCVGGQGHVFGVEAHPRTFRFLQSNIRLNQVANVTLFNSAAGDKQGVVQFSDSRYDDMNQVDQGTLQVPVARLDDLIPGTNPVALLKVDVEGYERSVFRGAPVLLSRTDCVYFEVGDKMCADFGHTAQELLGDVAAHGFQLFIADDRRHLVPLNASQSFTPYQNVVAIRRVEDLIQRTGWTMSG
jgi:FkbM family methyltransferase